MSQQSTHLMSVFQTGLDEVRAHGRHEAGAAPARHAVLAIDDWNGLCTVHGRALVERLATQVEGVLRRTLPTSSGLEHGASGVMLLSLPVTDLPAELRRLQRVAADVHVAGPDGPVCCTLTAAALEARDPTDPAAWREALRRAEAGLADARVLGPGRIADATPPRSEVDLTHAIEAGLLAYHVQPVVELRTGRIAGVEALLRLGREARGPGDLVDALERVPEGLDALLPDLIEQIAAPILARPDTFVALNVTGAVLDGGGSSTCLWLRRVLDRLPPERLVLEVVETAVIARPDRAEQLLAMLREKGTRIAWDDFGTGLSNLERLRRVPADILKVDRAFVSGLGREGREEIILRNLARMAADLGMEIVAEGIETAEQARAVTGLGIRYGQGYHLGRPAPVEDWVPLLDTPLPV